MKINKTIDVVFGTHQFISKVRCIYMIIAKYLFHKRILIGLYEQINRNDRTISKFHEFLKITTNDYRMINLHQNDMKIGTYDHFIVYFLVIMLISCMTTTSSDNIH